MKRNIKCIYMVWRRGRSDRRIKVGLVKRNQTEGITFRYIEEGVKKAMLKGFNMYPDFPSPNEVYQTNVMDILAGRLTNPERADIQKYYDFWEISPDLKDDRYYVLAQTQGLLPTDNFEFIAEYYPVKDLRFMSEICGLSHYNIDAGTLTIGDKLTWELEKNNPYDSFAVKLYKGDIELGYVKTIHSKIFYTSKRKKFDIIVKSIEQNGHSSRAFIAIRTI